MILPLENWREYAREFKGKKQLTWSVGMRDMLKLGAMQTDEEIAESVPENAMVYATITSEQWQWIIRNHKRGEILHHAGYMEQEDFANWLADLLQDI